MGHDWHQLGRGCATCGFLAVPAQFYPYREGHQTKEQIKSDQVVAEAAYLGTLTGDIVEVGTKSGDNFCGQCGVKKREAGRRVCAGCRKAKQRVG